MIGRIDVLLGETISSWLARCEGFSKVLDYDGSYGQHDRVYTAGRIAAAGTYQRVDVRTNRTIVLDHDDWLPASFDGSVALYRRISQPIVAGYAYRAAVDSRSVSLVVSR